MPGYNYVPERFPSVERIDGVRHLLIPTPNCQRCSLPISLDFAAATGVCRSCHANDPVDGVCLRAVAAATLYIPEVEGYPHSQEIREFKDSTAHGREFASVLQQVIAERWPKTPFASAALVPSSSERKPKLGLQLLGTILARAYKVPLIDGIVFDRPVASQRTMKGREARRANVANAMRLDTRAPAGNVLILDDVATTGFSLAEATRVLMDQGATACFGAVVGRVARLDYLERIGVIHASSD